MLGLECESGGTLGGILAQVGDDYISDATWHCSNSFQTGWSGPEFDDSTWQYASVVPQGDYTELANSRWDSNLHRLGV